MGLECPGLLTLFAGSLALFINRLNCLTYVSAGVPNKDVATVIFHYLYICSDYRSSDNVEEVCNMLEAYSCQVTKFPYTHTEYTSEPLQVENIQSRVQMLREMIDRSESVILINLDSQRNIMLRLGLQLEMGTFSAAIAGLIGMAFGMNLTSSLEDVRGLSQFIFLTASTILSLSRISMFSGFARE